MKVNELINDFEIWTTNAEAELLERLKRPITPLASLFNTPTCRSYSI